MRPPTAAHAPRWRVALLTALLLATTFAVDAAPVDLPAPLDEALGPQPVQAGYCASNAAFSGRLTASSSSTTALSRVTSPTVYGYISNVQSAWSCTAFYRYSGITWNTTSTLGTFAWGNLINSASVSCNFVVGSSDYVKGNSTSDCPDTDAEYALSASLSTQGVYQRDLSHDGTGDFSFVQTDCASYYGANPLKTGQSFSTSSTGNRPNSSNCDPIDLDDTNTTQTITYDSADPTVAITAPGVGPLYYRNYSTYTPVFNPSDNVAGFGGSYLWYFQRQTAPISGVGACSSSWTAEYTQNGTVQGSQSAAVVTLTNGICYRWKLTATDQNQNGPVSTYSGAMLIDRTAPTIDFSTPNENTTTTQNTTSYSVAWAETETQSGVATRSLQRKRVAATSSACPGTFVDDPNLGNITTASPSAETLTSGYCYQWTQTITDNAGNQTVATSGKVYVDAASPAPTFTAPTSTSTILQSATSYTVTWTESAPAGYTITGRSLQRQRGAIVTPSTCTDVTWANDGTPYTGTSPRLENPPLLGGYCYRWVQTLTNSAAKTGAATSGWVLVDTTTPTGSISTPAANATLSGDVVIAGQASDAHSFKEYQLEYGVGAAPASWTSIGTYTAQVTSGTLATWDPGTLSGVYTIRLTVRQNASTATATATRTVVLENAERGDEAFYTRVPFDLGGGWGLDVGVHNGEARLSRDLLSIPSYGPAQALGLSYSSLETGTTGRFGVGWSSTLTQYLTFDATDMVVWHRADGGRVPFGKVAGVWTALAGHFETLSVSGTEYTITAKDQTKLVFYDAATGSGRLKRIENRFGKALTLVWNTSSATATDASGRVTNLVIDAGNNRITGVTDSAGRAWTFGYTGTALTSVTDPAAKVTTLGYTSGLLTGVTRTRTKAAGGTDTVTWTVGYTSGKATSVTDPVAATTASTFTYNAGSTDVGILRQTSPSVVRDTTTYAFDPLGRVTDLTDPEGYFTTTTWDTASNPTAIASPIGTGTAQSTTTYTYDAKGNVLTETVPIDASTSVVTVNTYNATNDLLTRTDADNDSAVRMVTKYTYDGSGHLTGTNVNCTTSGTTPPASGQGGTCTGAGIQDAATNLITNYAYTANDQLSHEQDPLGRVTKYGYDTDGNQTSVTRNCTTSGTTPPSPFSSCTAAGTADAQTNVTETTTYDQAVTAGKAGLPTKTTDPLGRDTTSTYDALGRQLTEVAPGDTSIPVLTRTSTYDEFGNVLTETEGWTPIGGGSAVSRTTTSVYDESNRETSVTDPAGVETTTAYDLAGNATSATAGGVTTTRVFDGLGRSLSETDTAGTTDHAFDAQGNEIATTSAEGETTDRAFTRTGWLLDETVDPAGEALTTSHAYDRLGQETKSVDPAGTASRTGYDRAGRACRTVASSTQSDATWNGLANVCTSSVADPSTATTSDRAGNAVAVLGTDGKMSASLVDPLDRVTSSITNCTNSGTTVPAAGSTCAGTGTINDTTNVTTRTYHDATGAAIATKDPEGITTRTINNVRGIAKEMIANCTDSGTTPTTDPPGCTGGGTANATTNVSSTVTYDGTRAAVITIVAVGTGAAATTETASDAAGRVQAVKDPRGTITRSFYDATSGQLTKTVVDCTTTGTTIPTDWINCTGAGTQDGTYNLTTTYGYDAAGNQTSVIAPNGRETRTTHDADGRVETRTDNYVDGAPGATDDLVTTHYYDDAGRQSAVSTPTADGSTFAITRYLYDPDGRLWKDIRGCVDATANTAPFECDGDGTVAADTNVITEYQYDAKGNRIRLIVPDPSATSGTSTATVTTQYAYDSADRLCRVVENATGSTDLQTLADPCVTATQTAGTTTTNVSTRYTYDGAGNLATMVDARGNATTYAYDAAGRLTGLTDPLGETLVWVYDNIGNRIRQENRSDTPLTPSVTWTYDGAGRIATRVADGVTTSSTYDAVGNKLTASDGTLTTTATYDRLNRPLTIDDEDAGTGADTTYTYSLTSPAWTDPTGAYSATLDKFDRPTAVNDPVNATDFTWTYRADGQPASFGQPNGNATDYSHDALGHLTGSDTDTGGGTDRAVYAWTHNRAGQILSENSTVSGDPSNGTVTYAYDPLERLTGATLAGTTTTYGWDKVPNRTSVQVGAGSTATTTYDAANRPTSGTNPTATYTSDDDGRLTAAPGYQYTWDHLGRLTQVKNGAGTTLATYSYDPLDRLRLIDYPSGTDIRFRYTGLTTSVAQWLDDAAGTVTRSVANGWTGERLADWTGSGSNLRVYGTNGHHDVTWLAGSTGTVSQSLRYDPWGTPRSTVPSGYSPFRFQGSWFDDTTALAWVVTRWYAPSLGRFISEDSLLGEPVDPPSQHLYAYGQGEPIGRWDPDGRDDKPAVGYRWFANRAKFKGRIEIGLFIAAEFQYVPGGFRTYGDNRTYSTGHVRCSPSRACITIDFDKKFVRMQVNATCTDWRGPFGYILYGCNNAFAIKRFGQCGSAFDDRCNLLSVTETWQNVLKIRWDVTQSRLPIVRPDLTVNGSLEIEPKTSTRGPRLRYDGEGFPSEEGYHYRTGFARRTLFRHKEGSFLEMADWYGEWHSTTIMSRLS